ncbi:acyl carrier protein (plasmid) [Azospirillum argentinense]|uniref:Acyl carrier protein n=1 Tax=Azospirillum argentinense TaxID=2970906 RepID=A0A4D8PWK6_9PROT|nr:acyl carrier protein [Azospirillum argentinense]QCO00279.1 acyl carrier protein [Azospirillum argentinense]
MKGLAELPCIDPLDRLKAFIVSKNKKLTDIDPDFDIIENRLIDSLQFIEFVYLIQELSGRSIALDKIDLDHFKNLNTIRQEYFL